MLTPEENEVLTRVGPGDPMGRLMRRFWTPVCLLEEIAEPDAPPLLVEVLGERFVAFRDSQGRVGLLDELCPHRRASLVLGRNEDCGLRCLYHGWKMDVTGKVVAMAAEPPDSPLVGRASTRAYPVREWGGFLWAWLGEDAAPAFRPPAFAPRSDVPMAIVKMRVPANWAQVHEGQIDSAHSSSLHASDMVPARVEGATADEISWYRPSTDKSPHLDVEETGYGLHYAAIRRPIRNAATHQYVRITEFVAPYLSLIPPNDRYKVASLIVPIDDVTTAFHFIAWDGPACPTTEQWRAFNHARPGVDLVRDGSSKRTLANWFGQDREAMKTGSFTGIDGIPNQDMAMWVSMGAIVDRSRELLGSSDQAIVAFRRYMISRAGAAAGLPPPEVDPRHVAAFEGVIPKGVDWRTLNARGGALTGGR